MGDRDKTIVIISKKKSKQLENTPQKAPFCSAPENPKTKHNFLKLDKSELLREEQNVTQSYPI